MRGDSATGGSLRWNDPDRFDGFDLSHVAAAPQAVHRMMGIPMPMHKPTPWDCGSESATDFAPPAPPIHIGSDFVASRAFFGGFDAGWGVSDLEHRLNHPTPATQFGIVLKGTFSITTTDGETRRLSPGSVFRLEDTSPCKGHITVVGDQPGFLMFVR